MDRDQTIYHGRGLGNYAPIASRILVFSIHKAWFPITTEILLKICNNLAEVMRIVVVNVPGIKEITGNERNEPVQAMIELSTIQDAITVKNGLD